MAKNNATDKLIGFDFQKLIALEACFDGKAGTTVYLECYGDVSDGKTITTEVKHHQGKTFLSDKSIDFWKTLRNLIVDISIYKEFDEFIIHTTSSIGKDSIFENWEIATSSERLEKVKSISPNQTIQSYHDVVVKTPDKTLETILSKLKIKADQPSIEELHQKLLVHPILKSINPLHTKAVIERLHGHISLLAIRNVDNWHITQDDFLVTFRSECRNYMIDELIFPIVSKNTLDTTAMKKEYHFCKELKEIKHDNLVSGAVIEYLRAGASQIQILTDRPSLVGSLTEFEDSLKDEMIFNKNLHASEVKIQGARNKDEYSRKLFKDCMTSPSTSIGGVTNVQVYYPRGRMHSIVESGEFSWIFKEDEHEI